MQKYELKTLFDGRKSFWKKAYVIENDDNITELLSYKTIVAYIKDGEAYINGLYSNTTTRHIKEFLKQHGFTVKSTAQIMFDYKDNQYRNKFVEENNQFLMFA